MLRITQHGDFKRISAFLNTMKRRDVRMILHRYGKRGVDALSSATPVDSGKTAASWGYKIRIEKGNYQIIWTNSNTNKGVNIAVIIQYGHGTRTGGYVAGVDYINPALSHVFHEMADELWMEVENA